MNIEHAIAALATSLALASAVQAVELGSQNDTGADVYSEIVIRCHYQMGEFGSAAVNMCIGSEHEARDALSRYPEETTEIVWRCIRAMYDVGWGMIKNCSDNDIVAQKDLRTYSPEFEAVISACRDKVGQNRHSDIKNCVDAQLAQPLSAPR